MSCYKKGRGGVNAKEGKGGTFLTTGKREQKEKAPTWAKKE